MDTYRWSAIYNDNTILDERDTKQGFASVDQSRIKNLMLFSPKGSIGNVVIPEGAEAVFFRRRSIEPNKGNRSTVHCIGWKNESSAVYLFVFDDGSTLLTTDLQAV